MINFNKLVASVTILADTMNELLGVSDKIRLICDYLEDLTNKMSSSIDSYNSSYVSLSTFDNEGVETTSDVRKQVAYSPMRARLSVLMNKINKTFIDAYKETGVEYYPKVCLSVMCDSDISAFADSFIPVIVNRGDTFMVKSLPVSHDDYDRSSATVVGATPIVAVNTTTAQRVASLLTKSNAGTMRKYDDGTVSFGTERSATSVRIPFSIRNQDNSISQGILQCWLFFMPTNGEIYLTYAYNGTKYKVQIPSYAPTLQFSGLADDNLHNRCEAIADFVNNLNGAIVASLQTGGSVNGHYVLRNMVVDISICPDEPYIDSAHLIVFGINQTYALYVIGELMSNDYVQCRDMFDFIRMRRFYEAVHQVVFNPVES